MRSWVFRNRSRLEALLGRPPAPELPRKASEPARTPRVVVLQPARRGHKG